jgi:N-acetyl-1-D-myo-inositol-2-amino-2-deoxy-alpha-D-glucopyranoside deacetylase
MPANLTLLAVHAHPDDEAIATGGIIARYAAEGVRVALACATRGEVGEIVVPDLDNDQVRANLGAVREKELQCACGVLGISDLHFLNYRDSGMMGTGDNGHPESFWQADFEEATKRLVRVVREVRPQVMVTYDQKGNYGHPDHIMSHRVAVAAFDAAGDPNAYPDLGLAPWEPAKLYYIAFLRSFFRQVAEYYKGLGRDLPLEVEGFDLDQFGVPDEAVSARMDVRPFLNKKLEAMACHRSQIAADRFFFLEEGLVEIGLGYEHFTLARSRVEANPPEDDMFAGVR